VKSLHVGTFLCLACVEAASAQTRDTIFRYMNMADAKTQTEFRTMTQRERNEYYAKTVVSPLRFAESGISGGINQWRQSPAGWELGASGFGKRAGSAFAGRAVGRTVTFGLESALHEDNRYFLSGYDSVWSRTRYALASSVLARRDNGRRTISVSELAGQVGAAFISRAWQPPGANSPLNGAEALGYGLLFHAGFSVAKEFLPDAFRKIGIQVAPARH
jgi:hypothetical protein